MLQRIQWHATTFCSHGINQVQRTFINEIFTSCLNFLFSTQLIVRAVPFRAVSIFVGTNYSMNNCSNSRISQAPGSIVLDSDLERNKRNTTARKKRKIRKTERKLPFRTEQPLWKMRAHPRATDKRNACTHTRVRPVFHVFTLGRVAAGVTCTRLHTDEHRTGTVAPVGHTNVHACVTSLCLFVLCTSTRT